MWISEIALIHARKLRGVEEMKRQGESLPSDTFHFFGKVIPFRASEGEDQDAREACRGRDELVYS